MIRPAHARRLAVLLPLVGLGTVAAGQDDGPKNVKSSLVIVTPMSIASIAVMDGKAPARDAVLGWIKPVFKAVESQFAAEKVPRTVVVQVTLHPDRDAEVVVAGRPAPSEEEVKAILKVADASKLPRSRAAACVLRIMADINGGDPDKDKPFSPPLTTPGEARMAAMRAASTAEKLAILQRWARSEAIPLIGEVASGAEPKFEGVRNLGAARKKVGQDGPIDVAALTDRSPDYWRAMLEMVPGLPLIPATSVALRVANGELDSAQRIDRTLAPFDRRDSAYSTVIAEFRAMAALFQKDVESRIRKGIALHDAGKFDEALAAYDALLKDYPRSAWCRFERHQTLHAKALKNSQPLPEWAPARKAILRADPLYGSMAQASSGDELYDLMLRKESAELFRDKSKGVKDLVRYADIAADLGQYGFAAMIFWNLASNVKPKDYDDRDLIEQVLYCVEKLGVKDLKANFKGDHAAAFKAIDAEREKRKAGSQAKRVMAKSGHVAPKRSTAPVDRQPPMKEALVTSGRSAAAS